MYLRLRFPAALTFAVLGLFHLEPLEGAPVRLTRTVELEVWAVNLS
jgi:hypothetical protein